MNPSVRILLLAGGGWHDFDGFAEAMKTIIAPQGFKIDFTYDPDCLLQLEEEQYQLVISYMFRGTGRNNTGNRRQQT